MWSVALMAHRLEGGPTPEAKGRPAPAATAPAPSLSCVSDAQPSRCRHAVSAPHSTQRCSTASASASRQRRATSTALSPPV
jgi:hypothetical protein